MLRYFVVSAFGVMLISPDVYAADLPMSFPKHVFAKPFHAKKLSSKVAILRINLHKLPRKSVFATKHEITANKLASKPVTASPHGDLNGSTVDLSWTLGPLVANADGGKNEASASVLGNLVIDKPGAMIGPKMTIELIGHIIKTPDSVVRLDVQIGAVKRTVTWNADEIKSGKFKITLDDVLPAGALPETLPASALAFVTKQGGANAAMISLEKINLHISKLRIAGSDDEQ